MSCKKWLLVLPTCISVIFFGSHNVARADEGESVFSVDLGGAGFSLPEYKALGGAVGIEYEYGLTDAIWARTAVSGGIFAGDDESTMDRESSFVGHSVVGITYLLDVLKYVPYINLGIGGLVVHKRTNPRETELHPLIQGGVGLDVLAQRDWSYGIFARFESLISRSAYAELGVRISWRWGFF